MRAAFLHALLLCALPSYAGPPYSTDDPEPVDYGHYEAYVFGSGTATRQASSGAAGIDASYGARPDLHLNVVLPIAYERPQGARSAAGAGNIELAAKYRFAHQQRCGWDVSLYPRWILRSAARSVGEQHHAVLLPIWLQKDWGSWSAFGGGGRVFNRGGDGRDYTIVGWALTRQLRPRLQLGAEIFHRSADAYGALPTTGISGGLRYDASEHYHLLGSVGPGIQNASATNTYSWYLALQLTR